MSFYDTSATLGGDSGITASQNITASDIDWSTGNVFYKSISGNTTFTFSNDADGQTIVVGILSTGSFTVTWPAGVQWAAGSAPTQTDSGDDV